MTHERWTRQQLVKTLSLYCRIPFGMMHSLNPDVELLASMIGRTPSAVALKLVNFASLDPELQNRGIAGMGNTSAADRDIWAEFYGRWEALSEHVFEPSSTQDLPEDAIIQDRSKEATEVMREVRQRRGQSFFRSAVLAAYQHKCCITGITNLELLRASHIVPWAVEPSLRLDPHNGLCLNALHDAAFDSGLISLTDRLELLVSKHLRDEVPKSVFNEMFEKRSGLCVDLPDRFRPTASVLEYHRMNIFRN